MAKYIIRDYQKGFEAQHARIGIEVARITGRVTTMCPAEWALCEKKLV
jgi:hypothetical protein